TSGTYLNKTLQRRKKLDPPLLRCIQREVVKTPQAPLTDITNSSQLNISQATIYHSIKKLGYNSHMARIKPYHTRESQRVQLGWCKHRKSWNLMDWRNRVGSDEVVVQIGRNGKVRVW